MPDSVGDGKYAGDNMSNKKRYARSDSSMDKTERPDQDPGNLTASKFLDEPVDTATRKVKHGRILHHGAVTARKKRTTSKKLLRDGLSEPKQDKPQH